MASALLKPLEGLYKTVPGLPLIRIKRFSTEITWFEGMVVRISPTCAPFPYDFRSRHVFKTGAGGQKIVSVVIPNSSTIRSPVPWETKLNGLCAIMRSLLCNPACWYCQYPFFRLVRSDVINGASARGVAAV
ncbi:hypothetical protein D3C86_1404860 [compost metagenome]